jgi:hypothetical protein
MGFHAQLIECHISFLHETGRREKGFVSWPRNVSALFPKTDVEGTCQSAAIIVG